MSEKEFSLKKCDLNGTIGQSGGVTSIEITHQNGEIAKKVIVADNTAIVNDNNKGRISTPIFSFTNLTVNGTIGQIGGTTNVKINHK